MRNVAPFVVFLTFLGLWTWKLLEPYPVPEAIAAEIPLDLSFLFAKSLHASAYAFLVFLGALLPIRRPYFWVVIAILALHGVGTEIGQTYIPSRHGCIQDVLIDWTGISLGVLVLWICGFKLWSTDKSATPNPWDDSSPLE